MFTRDALPGLAVIALVIVAGCSGVPAPGAPTDSASPSPSPATPPVSPGSPTTTPTSPDYESYVFDHAGVGSPAIEGGISYRVDGSYTTRYYVTTVTTAEGTARFNDSVLDAGARNFVANTSFGESALVVIQAFPDSSVPDYRVETVSREGGTLRVWINDSSRYATGDITVETILLRVHGEVPERVVVTTEEGHRFDSTTGPVTVTPEPTLTPTPDIELPYTSENDSENVPQPRDIRIVNEGEETNGYRITVVYNEEPDCRDVTPPCGMPNIPIEILDRRGKIRPGTNLTIEDVAARMGTYHVEVEAELPAGNGSRVTVTETFDWRISPARGDLVVTITDEDVRISTRS